MGWMATKSKYGLENNICRPTIQQACAVLLGDKNDSRQYSMPCLASEQQAPTCSCFDVLFLA